MRLTDAAIKRIQDLAGRIHYGKITIIVNEESQNVDVTVEERVRIPQKAEDPRPGMVVRAVSRKG